MSDLPDAETCTCGHPKSTHGPGPKIATPIFCQGSSTCTCVIFTSATKSTDPPDAETAWREWLKANGLNDGSSQRPSDVFLAGFAAASGPWAEQLDAANEMRQIAEYEIEELGKRMLAVVAERDDLQARLDAVAALADRWDGEQPIGIDGKPWRSQYVERLRAAIVRGSDDE